MTVLLDVAAVSKSFGGVKAVQDVSLTIGPGERVALIGPNGAGKSTLFDVLSGLQRPDEGNVVFQGKDITNIAASKRSGLGIARTFQVAPIFASLTVAENVEAALLAASKRSFWPFGRLSPRGR